MKKNIALLVIAAVFVFSCFKEKNTDDTTEEQTDKSALILGKWDATELKIDSNTASDQVKFGKQILDHLTNKECVIISFTFNTDSTVLAEDSVNYLSINIGGTGLDIPCPEEKDSLSSTYTYDGETLTLIDAEGTELTAAVSIEDDTMSIDAKALGIENFEEDGQLIFKKRE